MSNHVSVTDLTALHRVLPASVHFFVFDENEYKLNEKNITGRKVTFIDNLTPDNIKKMISIIEKEEPVLLFPEMRISSIGSIMKIYDEIAFIALRTQAKIYPVCIQLPETKPAKSIAALNPFQDKIGQVKIGEPFHLNVPENEQIDKKKFATIQIYNHLTSLFVQFKLNKRINLFNELVEVSKYADAQTTVIKDHSTSLTYKKFLLSIHVLSSKMESTLKDELRVGVLLPSSVGQAICLFSMFKIGVVPAVLNFTMGYSVLIDCCETADIKTIITSKQFIEVAELHELVEVLKNNHIQIIYIEELREGLSSREKIVGLKNHASNQKSLHYDNEVILFTSGSENKPKGVILTHENIYSNIQQAMSVMDLNSKDKMLNPLPMFHSFGLTIGTILPLISGIPLIIHPSPIQYKVIPEIIYQEEITVLLSTPTFLNGYGKNAHPYDFRSIRYAVVGAESVKEELKELFYQKFGIRILEGYGATEASPLLSLNTPLHTKANSVGKLIPSMEYKIEKVEGIENGGSLLVKGPNVMKGYLLHDKGFVRQEGWYNTGDVVEVDPYGFITIKSRLKRFAKVGGEMVSLNLVEEISSQCFDDLGFAAVSIPDKRKGEKIVLFTNQEQASLKELKRYVKAHKHSPLILPAEIKYMDEIPLLGSGKTDYVTLEMLALEVEK